MDELQLILVDLDNVRGDRPRPLADFWLSDLELPAEVDAHGPPCVVVFAMNLNTADEHMTFDGLRGFAEHLAGAIARAPLRGHEIALTLCVKEAADAALERLLVKAPSDRHEGGMTALYLVSDDRGLQASIGQRLGNRYEALGSSPVKGWGLVGDRKKKPQRRRGPKPAVAALGMSDPNEPNQTLHSHDLVGQLAGRSVDVLKGASLQQIAASATARCGVLTQVGLTSNSLRGVDRVQQLAEGKHPSLSPCAPEDGVELCADAPATGGYAEPLTSSLGPGAIRFRSPAATVATLLPPVVIEAAQSPFVVNAGILDDPELVRGLGADALASADLVDVRFSGPANGLRAEVERKFGRSLGVWWWRASGKTQSKVRLDGTSMPPTSLFTAKARLAVHGDELILVAPFTDTVFAVIEEGQGRIVPAVVEKTPVACLRPLRASRGRARQRPIQSLSKTEFLRTFPEFRRDFESLRRLPLLVPG